MKTISLAKEKWSGQDLFVAYPFRLRPTDIPAPKQYDDCVAGEKNEQYEEGYDNFSLLTPELYQAGVKATLHCAFEGLGCPEIILVPKAEEAPEGVVRYGACFEVVLYQNGINVWRHYREDGRCFWHKRLGMEFPVEENTIHTLEVTVKDQYLEMVLDGTKTSLRAEDLPEQFHLGITACEGIVRLYDLTIEKAEA